MIFPGPKKGRRVVFWETAYYNKKTNHQATPPKP